MTVSAHRFKRFLVIAGTVLYTLLAAEVFLRIFYPIPLVPRYVVASSLGIRANQPNATYWHVSPHYRIQMRTNSKGIRADREIPYEKPAGIKRILLLGDSFGMGYEVDLKDTFLRQMEVNLNQMGIPCETINLSVSGFGNAEELILLREEGLKYSPDLVVLAWHSTDYDDNVRSGLFALKDGKLVRKNATYLPGTRAQEILYSIPGYQWIADNSQFYNFAREQVAVRTKAILAAVRKKGSEPTEGSEPDVRRGEDLAIALLREIHQEVISAGARFLILDVPGCSSDQKYNSTLPDINRLTGIPVYCPIEDFLKDQDKPMYWREYSHRHFTPEGTQIVGLGLARTARELLTPSPVSSPATVNR
jgi:hypothetical protein